MWHKNKTTKIKNINKCYKSIINKLNIEFSKYDPKLLHLARTSSITTNYIIRFQFSYPLRMPHHRPSWKLNKWPMYVVNIGRLDNQFLSGLLLRCRKFLMFTEVMRQWFVLIDCDVLRKVTRLHGTGMCFQWATAVEGVKGVISATVRMSRVATTSLACIPICSNVTAIYL